jgi:hypothetical protein
MDQEGSKLPDHSASITTFQRTADSPSTVLFCLKARRFRLLSPWHTKPPPPNARLASSDDDRCPTGTLHSLHALVHRQSPSAFTPLASKAIAVVGDSRQVMLHTGATRMNEREEEDMRRVPYGLRAVSQDPTILLHPLRR